MKAYLKRKRRKRTLLVSGFLAILALILVLGYVFLIRPVFADERQVADNPPEVTGEAEPEPDPMAGEALVIPEPEPEPEEEPFDEFDIHVMMVGDDLLHMGLVNQGAQADGTRNYDFLFKDILDFIDAADIAIINQELALCKNMNVAESVFLGQEIHGKNKLIEVGDTGLDEVEGMPARITAFLKDAFSRKGGVR